MNENSYLNPGFMIEQCDAAIQKLQRDNEALHIVENNLNQFIQDDELKSQAFQALKQQISDYKTVIQAMCAANDSDIMDFSSLKGMLGDEVLIGSNILNQKSLALSEKGKDEAAAIGYENQADAATFPWMEGYYRWKANQYWHMADLDQELYNKWQEKEDAYDEIECMTNTLFSASADMRTAAQNAIASITGAFQNGEYKPDMNATWRNDIAGGYNLIIGSFVNRLRTIHSDGTVEYDWEQLQEWLKQDADDLDDIEYLVLIEIVDGMSVEDLEKFANMAYISHTSFDDVPISEYRISPVFVEMTARYQEMTRVTAALTIFDPDSTIDYDKNMIINQLSRAQVLQLITNMDTAESLFAFDGKHVKLSSEEEGGLVTYSLTLIRSDSYGLHSGEAIDEIITGLSGGEVSKLTLTIYPWGSSPMAEFHLDQYAQSTIQSMETSGWEVTGEAVCSFLISKGVGYVEPTGILYATTGYLISQTENYEQTVQINGAMSAIDAGNYLESLGISTQVVATEGFATNHIAFTNSVLDRRELTVRLALYNQSHEPITVEDVRSSLENGGEGLEGYVDWYYIEQGCDEVEEYWRRLGNIANEYRIENTTFSSLDVRDLSVEQLQELIKKEADSSYEINDAIMEGE